MGARAAAKAGAGRIHAKFAPNLPNRVFRQQTGPAAVSGARAILRMRARKRWLRQMSQGKNRGPRPSPFQPDDVGKTRTYPRRFGPAWQRACSSEKCWFGGKPGGIDYRSKGPALPRSRKRGRCFGNEVKAILAPSAIASIPDYLPTRGLRKRQRPCTESGNAPAGKGAPA
jgi:hypothetical protein